jgi:hypothetical protein
LVGKRESFFYFDVLGEFGVGFRYSVWVWSWKKPMEKVENNTPKILPPVFNLIE